MTPNRKIILFMQEKAFFIKSKTGLPARMYFNVYDERALTLWSENWAYRVWSKILENFVRLPENGILKCAGLSPGLCPFCALHNSDCKICEYAKNHGGECTRRFEEDDSDFEIILKALQTAQVAFTKEIYSKNLNKIFKSELRP